MSLRQGKTEQLDVPAGGTQGCDILVIEGPDAGTRLRLDAGALVVGTGAACGLRLTDRAVSAEHVRLAACPGGVAVTDLGSTNGTSYLGGRVQQVVLAPGAVLKLGRTRLALRSPETAEAAAHSPRDGYGALVGSAPAMRRLYAVLEKLERVEHAVLIHGETGAGKELVAREIHAHSSRRERPFEVFDCGAVPTSLAESELFGHVKGAFTGATANRDGIFVRAQGGTVFLDEIAELPLELQPKLLRVLESRELRPVGGSRMTQVDVRVVAATHRPLDEAVKAGTFRQDLYFRLNVIRLVVPPLRARREDIPLLVERMLAGMGQQVEPSADTLELLTCGYDWPGNVRELRNALAQVLTLGSMPESIVPASDGARAGDVDTNTPFCEARRRVLASFERDYLSTQLERAGNNLAKAARLSGMDRSYLKRLLREHGLWKGGRDEPDED